MSTKQPPVEGLGSVELSASRKRSTRCSDLRRLIAAVVNECTNQFNAATVVCLASVLIRAIHYLSRVALVVILLDVHTSQDLSGFYIKMSTPLCRSSGSWSSSAPLNMLGLGSAEHCKISAGMYISIINI